MSEAQQKIQQDRNGAQVLLKTAKEELERARELGYAGTDKDYADLNSEISKIEKQLTANEYVGTAFSRVKDRLNSFIKKQSAQDHG